jgi:hypothetical protein|tara:strand:- start:440 stop:706 length:267 start_codon:yes stop_codon:yes gene_type:complete
MENKKGRKYDREKWGWKDKSDIVDHNCHYSGLPSPSAYEDQDNQYLKNHYRRQYYNSKRKLKQDEFSSKVVLGCIIGVIILVIINLFI